ncbi:MAG TPA: hemolysin family protein [Candidatus Acidoferrales bacterium]|nr:hemolysin family protein [Candidatus Acidoferrales bacterium]
MIESFILAVVLFASASLCWGFVCSVDAVKFGKRLLITSIFISAILSIFAAIFFVKGFAELEEDIGILGASIVFALSFILSLSVGAVLSVYSKSAKMFVYVEKMLRGSGEKDGREEIIDEILDRSSETGQIDVLERELIESVLKFTDKTVREAMVPRGDIVAIDIDEDRRHFLHKVIEEGYSRLPVFRGSIDNIVGIIYAKDLLTMVESDAVIVLHDLLRPPYYVPATKKISQLLREMQRDKIHLAVVVDEFGGTEGIVTLEDVLEEIVGEIQDEYDENPSELTRDPNGDVHIAGLMTVNRFNELLEAGVPQSDDYDTMAGFVQKLAGKLPQKDEIYNHEEMFFIIEEVARHRIKRLRVSFKEHPAQTAETNDTASDIDRLTDVYRRFQRQSGDRVDPSTDRSGDSYGKKKSRNGKKKNSRDQSRQEKMKTFRKPGEMK